MDLFDVPQPWQQVGNRAKSLPQLRPNMVGGRGASSTLDIEST